jgi:glycosyltransferase involved in cell wall biosynthesis
MPSSRPVTIYKGHDLDWYTAQPADLRELGIPQGAFTIACVANYRPRKGIEVLVEALAELPPDCNAHLLLIGQMDSPRLTAAIRHAGVEARVHRFGFRADAPSITAACDLFVLPSVRREGLARSLIEAMAYGIAPVVTDCGGSPELVRDEQCGLVVPVRDPAALGAAIIRLWADPELRRRLGAAARDRIANDFRIETTIEKTLRLYEELMDSHGG